MKQKLTHTWMVMLGEENVDAFKVRTHGVGPFTIPLQSVKQPWYEVFESIDLIWEAIKKKKIHIKSSDLMADELYILYITTYLINWIGISSVTYLREKKIKNLIK